MGVLLWKVRRVMAEFGRDYELLVYDDGSTDRTAEVLARYAPMLPLTVLRGPRRLGYGGALEALIRAAVSRAVYPKRDVVVVLQGDFTEPPEGIVPLVKLIEGGADIAVSRWQGNGRLPRGTRLVRWALPFLLQGLHRGAPVSDPVSGFRAYRVVVLKRVLEGAGEPLLRGAGWAANVELLMVAAPHARRIEEVPVRMRYDIRTRPSRLRPLATARHLVALARHSRGARPEAPREQP